MNTWEAQNALMAKAKELAQQRPSKDEIAIEQSAEILDQIQNISNREISLDLMSRNWMTAHQVAEALARIEDGSYGECERCGEAISDARLKAIPWAKYCRDCQEIIDTEGGEDGPDEPLMMPQPVRARGRKSQQEEKVAA